MAAGGARMDGRPADSIAMSIPTQPLPDLFFLSTARPAGALHEGAAPA
jgi:hypothetical protein